MAMDMEERVLKADCVIVGGGPGGLMLGLLLARAGIEVTVIEKHGDFLRDFRGDTIHPSTLEAIDSLGLIDAFLKLPHTRAPTLSAEIGGRTVTIADFSRLPLKHRFIAFMPQWDFLDFIAGEAARYPGFRLLMNTSFTGLIDKAGQVAGVTAEGPDGALWIEAPLTIGADGRNSRVRDAAGLEVESFGSPSDVVWMRFSHDPTDPAYTMGHVGPRQGFVMIDRGDYWQCGYVVRKGSFADVKEKGIDAFRAMIAEASPLPADRVSEIRSWDDVHLLSVRIDRLKRWWKPGLLCIGDAAHAMSPIGGVGVNLAIQDAIAAANVLVEPLKRGNVTDRHLAAVEARRLFPVKALQKLQLMMRSRRRADQDDAKKAGGPPGFVRAIARMPLLAHLAGRLIGVGIRMERVKI